mmetsp:Transcript_30672/g.53827  ORF Transcript_30672/g.53827 Transcript_30672/m.53827 type:complete len:149 (+) Transcript_30672:2-448(+)
MLDCPCTDILHRIRPVMEFIHKARLEGSGVLVHCLKGVSRSGAMLVAYIMSNLDVEFVEGFSFLKSKRWHAFPNPGFQRQLRDKFDRSSCVSILGAMKAGEDETISLRKRDKDEFESWKERNGLSTQSDSTPVETQPILGGENKPRPE